MDGLDKRGSVILIGATNRPDAVDPALRRPGRFDREFYFPLPDAAARANILQVNICVYAYIYMSGATGEYICVCIHLHVRRDR
jgi:ATP-dependent 26S proteasome regulatory subunit